MSSDEKEKHISHNELGKKIIIIANIIQENMQLLEIWTSSDKKKRTKNLLL